MLAGFDEREEQNARFCRCDGLIIQALEGLPVTVTSTFLGKYSTVLRTKVASHPF